MTEEQSDWYGPDTATFGDRVAGARDATGMSQAQLSHRLGVKKATLIAWEEDRSEPRANRLSMMAGLLNVSIVWLLTGEGDGTSGPEGEVVAAPDFAEVLAELRAIRADMRRNTERTGRLEKKLRLLVQQGSS